jgi:hypothetical protein
MSQDWIKRRSFALNNHREKRVCHWLHPPHQILGECAPWRLPSLAGACFSPCVAEYRPPAPGRRQRLVVRETHHQARRSRRARDYLLAPGIDGPPQRIAAQPANIFEIEDKVWLEIDPQRIAHSNEAS